MNKSMDENITLSDPPYSSLQILKMAPLSIQYNIANYSLNNVNEHAVSLVTKIKRFIESEGHNNIF